MRRYRLNMVLLGLGCIGLSMLSGWLLCCGRVAWGIASLLGAMLCVVVMIPLSRRVVHLTSSFVAALENNDLTMRFDIDSDDREISEVTNSMNRIISIYRRNQLELETRKLYYDRILRIMTHEMRNSITPVIVLANDYAAQPDKYDSEMLAETMEVIGCQAESIKKFLDSYYNLTHLPEPQKRQVSVTEFCTRIQTLAHLEEKQRGMGKNICHFSFPVDMSVSIDPDLMGQAVMNIIRNSLDAVADVANPQIDVSVSISGGVPFIRVSDNGPGLPESVKSNLFQPFISTKRGGSGIGLSLSRQIARLHGGDLTLTSSPHGTTATLTFS